MNLKEKFSADPEKEGTSTCHPLDDRVQRDRDDQSDDVEMETV
jgi:hypothetical protein